MARLLLVDNAKNLNDALAKLLRDAGYEVEQAFNGSEALLLLRDRPAFDVMVLDMKMPDQAGADVLGQLLPTAPPVIVMTGDEQSVPQPTPPVVRHVLVKVFETDELVAKIKDVLASSGSPPEGAK